VAGLTGMVHTGGYGANVRPPAQPELQPEDERSALVQRLDDYRAIASSALADVPWQHASARLLPATDMTIAGIVRHLAWAEDRWFQGRLLGGACRRRGTSQALTIPITRCVWRLTTQSKES